MYRIKIILLLCIAYLPLNSQAQLINNNFVELSGVVMSADSLGYLPFVTINILNKNRGTIASDKGVFTLLAYAGDTLQFTSIGYRDKNYVIPNNLTDLRYSIIQLMVQDTFFLPETIIRPGPTKEQFDYAFKYWDIPDDKYETARKNTDREYMALLSRGLVADGREAQRTAVNNIVAQGTWIGQRPPQNIFSPLAWSDFIKAWKRGDYRRKR